MDSSVLLAAVLDERRKPPGAFWQGPLTASRLTECEVWCRLNAYGRGLSHGDRAADLLGRLALAEMTSVALDRLHDAFPLPVRTLDAIHLATMDFLRREGETSLRLATYDQRLGRAAQALGFELVGLRPAS